MKMLLMRRQRGEPFEKLVHVEREGIMVPLMKINLKIFVVFVVVGGGKQASVRFCNAGEGTRYAWHESETSHGLIGHHNFFLSQ